MGLKPDWSLALAQKSLGPLSINPAVKTPLTLCEFFFYLAIERSGICDIHPIMFVLSPGVVGESLRAGNE